MCHSSLAFNPIPAINCCYPTGFQVMGLIFPTEGCWDVTAKAGDSELHFVTLVAPAEHPAAGGVCESLADAVKQSDAIVVGRVTDIEMDGRYAWDTVSASTLTQSPLLAIIPPSTSRSDRRVHPQPSLTTL
jgi:hypothetical protein